VNRVDYRHALPIDLSLALIVHVLVSVVVLLALACTARLLSLKTNLPN